jgi:hypothetical protein
VTGPDGQQGAVGRALLWVLVGLLAAAVLFAVVSPELTAAAPAEGAGIIGLVLIAGIPGLVILGVAAVRRHRLERDDPPGG